MANVKDEKTSQLREKYFDSYTNPHPIGHTEPHTYFIGEIYERYEALRDGKWPIADPGDGPYLRRIKQLSRSGWPQLRYLGDFMDCGTVPVKADMLVPEDREERKSRCQIATIDVVPDQARPQINRFTTSADFLRFWETSGWPDTQGYIRLIVLEDLSTTSIELLGGLLDIDPSFFRAHLNDYTWYNIRDPWFETPILPSRSAAQSFFTLRHPRPHYFRNAAEADQASRVCGSFNVLRRIDFDNTNTSTSDLKGSSVGSVRSSTSIYVRPHKDASQGWLGVLLVDPPVGGLPLWGGYDNIRPVPDPDQVLDGTEPTLFSSPMEDFLYWTRTIPPSEMRQIQQDNDYILAPIFRSVPLQWLLSFEHISNRLSLIEWEIETEEHRTPQGLDDALRRLHPWRRNVVNIGQRIRTSVETVRSRFGEKIILSSPKTGIPHIAEWRYLISNFVHLEARQKQMEAKIDRIMTVLTAVMAIEENKKQMINTRDVARITYLAFFYIPLSFVSSFLSMNTEFSAGRTVVYWVWFIISIPLTTLSLVVAIYAGPLVSWYKIARDKLRQDSLCLNGKLDQNKGAKAA